MIPTFADELARRLLIEDPADVHADEIGEVLDLTTAVAPERITAAARIATTVHIDRVDPLDGHPRTAVLRPALTLTWRPDDVEDGDVRALVVDGLARQAATPTEES